MEDAKLFFSTGRSYFDTTSMDLNMFDSSRCLEENGKREWRIASTLHPSWTYMKHHRSFSTCSSGLVGCKELLSLKQILGEDSKLIDT